MAAEKESALQAAAAKLAPGAFVELATDGYDYKTLMRGEDILAYTGKAAYDGKHQQVHFIGQVHLKGPPVHIRYDLASNAWKQMPTSAWAKPLKWFHAYDNNTSDVAGGYFFHNPSATGLIHQLDVANDQWTTLPELKAPSGHGMALVHFPARKSLIRCYGKQAWEYRMADRAWTKLSDEVQAGPYHNIACSSLANQCVLLGGGNNSPQLYRLDAAGKLTPCQPAPFPLYIGGCLAECDPVSGELVVIGKEAQMTAYDPGDDTWRELSATAPFKATHSVSVAPIHDAGVLLYFSSQPKGMKVWLYKHTASRP